MYEKREATEEKCFALKPSRAPAQHLTAVNNSCVYLRFRTAAVSIGRHLFRVLRGNSRQKSMEQLQKQLLASFRFFLERNPQRLGVGMEMRSRNDDGEALASLKLSKRIARSESC